MSYNLFLDDIRQPEQAALYMPAWMTPLYLKEKWEIVRNYGQFIGAIRRKGMPDIISFDHDLARAHYDPRTWKQGFVYKEKTGLDCAKWLIEYCLDKKVDMPTIYVHSQNPVGKKNIESLINNYKKYYNG
jgi:hypothetical protein